MKEFTTNPHIIGGMVSILIGVIVYFYLPEYAFTVYGIPLTTAILSGIGLAAICMGMKK